MKMDNSPARGNRDLLPAAMEIRDHVTAKVTDVYRRFGYQRIETPALEDIDRLTGGEGGENEKLIYRVLRRGLPKALDDGVALSSLVDLGLRYDLTVPLTRFYSNNRDKLPAPFRSLQIGPVWRAERPQRGRYRQFYQCDIDMIGEESILAEIELIEATTQALAAVGLGSSTVRISDRRLLSALASHVGVAPESVGRYFIILDKLDKVGEAGVHQELIAAGFSEREATRTLDVLGELTASSSANSVDALTDAIPSVQDSVADDLRTTTRFLATLDQENLRWEIDPTLVRGMGYYTGQIFEVSHLGMKGSIAGGGRYDGLVGKSLNKDVPACGFSLGFERIVDLLTGAPSVERAALLYGEGVSLDAVISLSRRIRASGRTIAPIRQSGRLKVQIARLGSSGFTSFYVIDDDAEAANEMLPSEKVI